MEVKTWDVAIVSAFGRSDWLAAELQSQGLSVFLIDVTSRLGNWPPEDIEGPFGLFMMEDYNQGFLECITHLDKFLTTESGFTVWTSEGPLELKSAVTAFRFLKLGLHEKIWDMLSDPGLASKYKNESFQKTWLLGLAHQLASTTYHPNKLAANEGEALALLKSFLVRSTTRQGFEKSLSWVQSKGVKVTSKTEILDVALSGRRQLTGFELKGEVSGFVRFDNLIWNLTSEETYFMSERIGKKLFPQGIIESNWSWVRFRMNVKDCLEISTIPEHICLIEDIAAPWTHDNFCLLQKTTVKENIDVWVRLPSVQRFNKEYLKEMGQRLTQLLISKMPLSFPEVQTYPQEYYYTYKELGAPRFPVYLSEDKASRKYTFFQNLYRDGFEVWQNFTRDCQYRYQSKLKDDLVKAWREAQLKKKEKELRA